ncbi:MAG: type VI secretion system contractile sheath large subunit, partial [Gammaproteobacteria bacterium]|nr:type VI secretion system contractile sheath large subunit [Gammaproteobacteria bacterium]
SSLRAFFQFADINQKISADELIRLINVLIARIDQKLNRQLNAILHHPKLQQLEASWRGLQYLTFQADEEENIKIRFLDVNWVTLDKDMDRAIEFDQSALFRKIYNNEFGTAGGEPFGVLLGDYYVTHRPSADHRTDDLLALQEISQVSAAAFAPFIASADPKLFGVDDFAGLGLPVNYEAVFSQAEYRKWNAFRETDDSRFVGLTLPRVLMRKPYEYDSFRSDRFNFSEDVSSPDGQHYLWGNAVYAFGAVLMQSFASNAWFTNIRGSNAGVGGGGIVSDLNVPSFKTDKEGVALKYATDVLVTDLSEKTLSELGFIPLCHSKDTEYAVFYSNQSVQGATSYSDEAAEINAKISGMLQYIMCVSRFAHYIKVIGREKIGSFFSASECEDYLYKWLLSYSTASTSGTEEHLAKYPLSEAKVEVNEIIGKPGAYSCTIHLKPHMQLDEMVSAVKLVTELSEVKT